MSERSTGKPGLSLSNSALSGFLKRSTTTGSEKPRTTSFAPSSFLKTARTHSTSDKKNSQIGSHRASQPESAPIITTNNDEQTKARATSQVAAHAPQNERLRERTASAPKHTPSSSSSSLTTSNLGRSGSGRIYLNPGFNDTHLKPLPSDLPPETTTQETLIAKRKAVGDYFGLCSTYLQCARMTSYDNNQRNSFFMNALRVFSNELNQFLESPKLYMEALNANRKKQNKHSYTEHRIKEIFVKLYRDLFDVREELGVKNEGDVQKILEGNAALLNRWQHAE